MLIVNNKFKNIFPDYETFRDWYANTPLSNDFLAEKGDDYEYTDVPSERTFTIIAYHYNGSTVNTSIESFKQMFANELFTYYKEFEATTKAIDELMALKDEDIIINDSMITNIADIPETSQSTNTLKVDFISQQQKMIQEKGKLRVKREQISNKRAYTTKTFINRFRYLFIRVLSSSFVYLVENDD